MQQEVEQRGWRALRQGLTPRRSDRSSCHGWNTDGTRIWVGVERGLNMERNCGAPACAVTEKIIKGAFEVYRVLGYGFLEKGLLTLDARSSNPSE